MTTNETIAQIADLLIAHNDFAPNMHELLELIEPLLARSIYLDLASMLEICPIHYCDLNICADDNELECAEYRN